MMSRYPPGKDRTMKQAGTAGRILLGMVIVFIVVSRAATPVTAAPFAYVANSGSSTVSVIDLANNTPVATVPVSAGPFGVAVHPNGSAVYVTHPYESTASLVSVIATATNTVTTTITVGLGSMGVTVHPSGTTFYVTNSDNPSVSVIDGTHSE